ncbi:MAG: IS21 family transposase, partial [Caldisericia bacterium]|nr:IS21 family transposase [Caldisericia bacterium]
STVLEYERKAHEAGLNWSLLKDMDDEALINTLSIVQKDFEKKPMPDTEYIIKELKKKHVTLTLLWKEYKEEYPEGYQFTQFRYYVNEAKKKLNITLRQNYKAGEKMFIDYAGDTVNIINSLHQEIRKAYIFVAVLGASNYTYAEASFSQDLLSMIDSNINALEFFGGVPELIVSDNLKCAVKKANRYEPEINKTFEDFANYYGTAILPARVRKPKDKAKVEKGVQIVEEWIIAALRNRTFFSLEELNRAIRELLDKLNNRKMKQFNASRKELFDRLEKQELKNLPLVRYEIGEWKRAKVNLDYHISVNNHLYSVPYHLIHEEVDVRLTAKTVEIFNKGKRIASHLRSNIPYGYTTDPNHRPKSHKEYLEWTPQKIADWAKLIGTSTALMIEKIFEERLHPEQGIRSCLGIISLSKRYPKERVEAACKRGLSIKSYSYKSIKSILEKGLDRIPLKENEIEQLKFPSSESNLSSSSLSPLSLSNKQLSSSPSKIHENIRGKSYYINKDNKEEEREEVINNVKL